MLGIDGKYKREYEMALDTLLRGDTINNELFPNIDIDAKVYDKLCGKVSRDGDISLRDIVEMAEKNPDAFNNFKKNRNTYLQKMNSTIEKIDQPKVTVSIDNPRESIL